MKKYCSTLPSIFMIAVIFFWAVPFIQDLLPAKDADEIVMTCIWLLNPLFCSISSFLYGEEQGGNWYLPLGLMLIFLPLPFLFYPIESLFSILLYGGASLIGMQIGAYRLKRKRIHR